MDGSLALGSFYIVEIYTVSKKSFFRDEIFLIRSDHFKEIQGKIEETSQNIYKKNSTDNTQKISKK